MFGATRVDFVRENSSWVQETYNLKPEQAERLLQETFTTLDVANQNGRLTKKELTRAMAVGPEHDRMSDVLEARGISAEKRGTMQQVDPFVVGLGADLDGPPTPLLDRFINWVAGVPVLNLVTAIPLAILAASVGLGGSSRTSSGGGGTLYFPGG